MNWVDFLTWSTAIFAGASYVFTIVCALSFMFDKLFKITNKGKHK